MKKELERYELAISYLPSRLRQAARRLSEEEKEQAEEIRIRSGKGMTVLLPDGEKLMDDAVHPEDLEMICDLATDFSRYAAIETIRNGYIPVRGGFRIGLCGTAVIKDGICTNLKNLSSAVIRISREQRGLADQLAPKLFSDGNFQSTLILSPPGGGKTTLLRDLTRVISNGLQSVGAKRISLIDERGEVAVCYQGIPQLDVGRSTDVLDGCPKRLGIPMVLRTMNPEIIAVDEITLREDVQAACMAAGCGVGLLATIHANGAEELAQKPLYKELIGTAVFRQIIRIERKGRERKYFVEKMT